MGRRACYGQEFRREPWRRGLAFPMFFEGLCLATLAEKAFAVALKNLALIRKTSGGAAWRVLEQPFSSRVVDIKILHEPREGKEVSQAEQKALFLQQNLLHVFSISAFA